MCRELSAPFCAPLVVCISMFLLCGCGAEKVAAPASAAKSDLSVRSPQLMLPRANSPLAAETMPGEGEGPGLGGDKFSHLAENPFLLVKDSPLSTFSIDVDTASYAK